MKKEADYKADLFKISSEKLLLLSSLSLLDCLGHVIHDWGTDED